LLVVRDRREMSDPLDQLAVQVIVEQLEQLDSPESRDSLDYRVRVDSQDSRVIRDRLVTLAWLERLEVPEALDNLGRKVPSGHLDLPDRPVTLERQEGKVPQDHKDSLEVWDSQVNCLLKRFGSQVFSLFFFLSKLL